MSIFIPEKILYEEEIKKYDMGRSLLSKYEKKGIEIERIKSHNNIALEKNLDITDFNKMKKTLTLGVRKSINLRKDNKSSDFIVPFTSAGCSASCLYCYLVHNFGVNSNLRIFVNRDDMLKKIIYNNKKYNGKNIVYEIGCNSDMILENSITNNLEWIIEEFSYLNNSKLTFATKFSEVDSLINLRHNGKTRFRISVNPSEIINSVEFKTANLEKRIEAANKMFNAGYEVGLNIAPIILVKGYERLYERMFMILHDKLDKRLKQKLFIEIIFMTYSLENFFINKINMPNAVDIFQREKFYEKDKDKFAYKNQYRNNAEMFIIACIKRYFPKAKISYMV